MSVIRQAVDKLRGARHIEWVLLVAALAALVLLMTDASEEPGYEATALEQRMENVLSAIEGAGRVRVLVNAPETAAVFSSGSRPIGGVLVVAEGADDLKVCMALQRAVQALLGIETDQIEILTMKEDDS